MINEWNTIAMNVENVAKAVHAQFMASQNQLTVVKAKLAEKEKELEEMKIKMEVLEDDNKLMEKNVRELVT